MTPSTARLFTIPLVLALAATSAACRRGNDHRVPRATGYVEATDVRVAPEVGGRVLEIGFREGDRIETGAMLAKIDTRATEIAIQAATADRQQMDAQLRLLQAGSRQEEIQQAASQVRSAQADVRAADAELTAATADVGRFESLLRANAGSVKQRDDAVTRRDVAAARQRAAQDHAQAAADNLARLRAGARPQEIDAARARVAAADAQIASLKKNLSDAVLKSPVSGIVTSKLIDPGEMIAPHVPLVVITDLDHAWANVYVDEPVVPQLKIGQPAVLVTDAGQRLDGSITFISPKAEFTPRNVQTAEERSKLVYRIKVTADNHNGVLKPGMPVEAELTAARGQQ